MVFVRWKWELVWDPKSPPKETAFWAPLGIIPPAYDAHIVLGNQANTACLWATVDPAVKHRWYGVVVVGTGDVIPNEAVRNFLGTVILTRPDRVEPAPYDNSVQHFYMRSEASENVAERLKLPVDGSVLQAENVVPLWSRQLAGVA